MTTEYFPLHMQPKSGQSVKHLNPAAVAFLTAPSEAERRVIHVKDATPNDLYIGRANGRAKLKASKWANPYKIGRDGDRDQVLEKYRAYVLGCPDLMDALSELDGKRLACWCAPEQCHGDVLLELRAGQLSKPDWLVHFEALRAVEEARANNTPDAPRAPNPGDPSLTPVTRYERTTKRFYPFRLIVLDYHQPASRLDLPRPIESPPSDLPSDIQFVIAWYLDNPDLIRRAVQLVAPPPEPKPPKVDRWDQAARAIEPLAIIDLPVMHGLLTVPAYPVSDVEAAYERRVNVARMLDQRLGVKAA